MRPVHLSTVACAVLAAVALSGCEITSSGMDEETTEEAASAEDGAEDASSEEGAAEDAMPEDVMAAVEKADTCREIATEADEVGMAAVQDQWDGAGCETLGDDLNAAREANADNADAIAALDHAARPMGT